MKNLLRKGISWILVMVLILGIIPNIDELVYAETSSDYEYKVLDDGTAEITWYAGVDTNVVVPETLDGYKVTSIGEKAFYDYDSLKSIKLPDCVDYIGFMAFWGCENLKEVKLSKNLKTIYIGAFGYCESLISIQFPAKTESIGFNAFVNCNSLTDVYYEGSEREWTRLVMDETDGLENTTIHYNYVLEPTAVPMATPTGEPTEAPTATPTAKPTAAPTVKPTATPTAKPTAAPTVKPTATPTAKPTATPTAKPTVPPTAEPTKRPEVTPNPAGYSEVIAGNSQANATEIYVGETYVTEMSGKSVDHWFKFTTSEEDAFYYLDTKNIDVAAHSWSSSLYAEVCTVFGEVILKNSHISSSTPEISNCKLQPNTTYYFKLYEKWEGTGGTFKFKISKQDDIDKDTREGSTEIELNKIYDRTIDGTDDEDWFTFTTGNAKKYVLYGKNLSVDTHSWSGDAQFRLTLYNGIREELTRITMEYWGDESTEIILEPNTVYYIKASNHLGGADYYGKENTYLMSMGLPEIDEEDITLSETIFDYTGKEKKPDVVVKYGETTLVKDKDYTVKYSDNVKVGTATVTVEGIGEYAGFVEIPFTIEGEVLPDNKEDDEGKENVDTGNEEDSNDKQDDENKNDNNNKEDKENNDKSPNDGSFCGDVNLDGKVNATDALLVLKHAAKIETLSGSRLTNGNTDGNSAVDATDALNILRLAANIIQKLPVK